ncbi:hypothetical protein [Cohnella sp. AR92]|uniref:hypothetical protein n=1 Tax=Cohnella sp. AR92 TaxID=648716 RepID=UPI000F8CB6C5|nr:hypothetical protein [Cohnella sp. AR92]RUS48497.1 hypothetical protein ELR57_03530 [Cohnella sp. AR92]
MSGKRSLTVPILLIVITGLAILIVLLLSKVLLNNQSSATDKGKRLAEQYASCQAFADTLESTAKALDSTTTAVERLPLMAQAGQLVSLEDGCAAALSTKAVNAANDEEQAKQELQAQLAVLQSSLAGVGVHEGPLTAEEKATLAKLQEGGAGLSGILKQYSIPTEDDRYRQMAAGAEWTKPAADAAQKLKSIAGSLSA